MGFQICFVVFFLACSRGIGSQLLVQPEQIHLSYGERPSEMVVTWVTGNSTLLSVVEYGRQGLTQRALGNYTIFTDGGKLHRSMFIHRVKITGLQPQTSYEYHCGSPAKGWSAIYFFRTMPEGVKWSPRFAIYGDMGNSNPQSLTRLQEETQRGAFDAIIHVGDFAYDMDSDNARVGDEFMRQIESVAAYIPYMTCPGNHENSYNFSNYRNRFTMPGGDGTGMYYSWNVGPAHIVSFSTEVYYYYTTDGAAKRQYEWLEADLIEANKAENRALRPWIITTAHRPMYCSDSDEPKLCTNILNFVRVGSKAYPKSLETLFYKHGVDLQIYAHEHNYERIWPMYDFKVCNGSREYPYTNPKAPVHIITGSAGCKEGREPFIKKGLPWSAFRSNDYGFSRMTIHNNTHLYLEQVSDDKNGTVIDKMWLKKDRHGAGTFDCLW
ncbi:hypothetical protein ScPMuIL_014171 [Solemya velum]